MQQCNEEARVERKKDYILDDTDRKIDEVSAHISKVEAAGYMQYSLAFLMKYRDSLNDAREAITSGTLPPLAEKREEMEREESEKKKKQEKADERRNNIKDYRRWRNVSVTDIFDAFYDYYLDHARTALIAGGIVSAVLAIGFVCVYFFVNLPEALAAFAQAYFWYLLGGIPAAVFFTGCVLIPLCIGVFEYLGNVIYYTARIREEKAEIEEIEQFLSRSQPLDEEKMKLIRDEEARYGGLALRFEEEAKKAQREIDKRMRETEKLAAERERLEREDAEQRERGKYLSEYNARIRDIEKKIVQDSTEVDDLVNNILKAYRKAREGAEAKISDEYIRTEFSFRVLGGELITLWKGKDRKQEENRYFFSDMRIAALPDPVDRIGLAQALSILVRKKLAGKNGNLLFEQEISYLSEDEIINWMRAPILAPEEAYDRNQSWYTPEAQRTFTSELNPQQLNFWMKMEQIAKVKLTVKEPNPGFVRLRKLV